MLPADAPHVDPHVDRNVGLYVHVPFCERICPYCDFAVVAARRLEPEVEDRTVSALVAELAARRPVFEGRALASVYLGGGTPSLLQPESVGRILEAARAAFPVAAETEVTLEVNPSSVERERLPGFRQAGVNRLSIGIQSFDDRLLRRLGRAHKAEEGRRTWSAARAAGFDNLSLDLLFAGPDATPDRLERDLDEAVSLAPEHVSVYELTIEPGTPFATAAARGQLDLPSEDDVVGMMDRLEARLEAAGLGRYEISSYARPGREARHNRRYWERTPVLGIGMGAWSTDPPSDAAPHGTRRANVRELSTWLERIESGRAGEASAEPLESRVARGEAMFLGLRRREGLCAARFAAEFGAPPRGFFAEALDEMVAAGLLDESPEGDLRLTSRGRILSDSVFERFV